MNQQAVNNFLSSLDLSLPLIAHYKNCMKDARSYKWDSKTLIAIMVGIEQRYEKTRGSTDATLSYH